MVLVSNIGQANNYLSGQFDLSEVAIGGQFTIQIKNISSLNVFQKLSGHPDI